MIYTRSAIESVNVSLRKLTRNCGSFPSDEALMKLFYLAQRNIRWRRKHRCRSASANRYSSLRG